MLSHLDNGQVCLQFTNHFLYVEFKTAVFCFSCFSSFCFCVNCERTRQLKRAYEIVAERASYLASSNSFLQDAEKLRQILSETEDWLYGDGEEAEKKVYEAKLDDLKKLGEPVQERYREFENRQKAFDDFDRSLIVIFTVLTSAAFNYLYAIFTSRMELNRSKDSNY